MGFKTFQEKVSGRKTIRIYDSVKVKHVYNIFDVAKKLIYLKIYYSNVLKRKSSKPIIWVMKHIDLLNIFKNKRGRFKNLPFIMVI